jgi:hypothetical protein
MLVVNVAVSLLLRWPSNFVIFAGRFAALPGTRVRLLVFRKITRSFENLVTVFALLVNVHGRCILLAASHGSLDALIDGAKTERTLHRRNGILLVGLARTQRDHLAILVNHEFSRSSVLG